MRARLTAALSCGVLLAACSGSPDPAPPTTSSTPSTATDAASPTAEVPEGPQIGASQVLAPDPAGAGVLLVTSPPEGGVDRGPLGLWRWDGEAWSQVEVAGEWPVARSFFAAAVDPERNVLVVHGGEGAPEVGRGETWEWDGTQWTGPAEGPPSTAASLAWDAGAGELVLYGGTRDATWTWDGRTWSRSVRGGPTPPRWPGAMAPDGAGGVVMYGGHQVDPDHPAALDDTWVWSRGAWSQVDAPGPGNRVNSVAIVHPRHGPLLAGGSDLERDNGDVWRWVASPGGGQWELFARDVLPHRQAMGMAYDAARDVVVLTGGVVEQGSTLRHQDVWEWSGDRGEKAVLVSDRPPA